MRLKWIQIKVENRKLKSQLITYSSNYNDNLMEHIEALESALDRLEDNNTIRIIIEKGEI